MTNLAGGEDFLAQVPRNPRFLYASLGFLSSEGLRALLRELGCDTVVERGGRVFPAGQKASDVTRALARALQGVDIRLNARAAAIQARPGNGFEVRMQDGETLRADAVIIATGGLSYPMTGSTGDGHALPRPAAIASPIHTRLGAAGDADEWARPQGLALKT